MKHVLGIIGSPRKTANCELLIKAVSKTIPEPHRLSLLKLSDFHIKPCRGCYLCLFKKENYLKRKLLYQMLLRVRFAPAADCVRVRRSPGRV